MLYAFLKAIGTLLLRLFLRLESHGREHVPGSGPALLVSNHSSFLDPVLVGVSTPRRLHFMAKAELFDVPVLNLVLRRLPVMPVRRDGADPSALRLALRVLEEGHAILVFPEGTRVNEGELLEGKAGVGMLAILSGAPVVPVYIEGAGRALPRGRFLPRPVKVRVRFGSPLRFIGQGNGRRKLRSTEASREIMAAISGLKAARPSDGYASSAARD